MKFKSLFILLLAAVWGIASWWWYTCKIKGFCGEQLQSAISNTLPTAKDLIADNDGQPEAASDEDHDGIPDEKERKLGLNEKSIDSDQDGVNDFIELGDLTTPLDTDDDGIINALDKDDDGDGYSTSEEDVDPNGDGDTSDARDSNYDGIPDYMDSSSNWGTEDDDGDGINNMEEKTLGTNTALTDSDADGVPDATEINQTPMDTDGDGIIDALDDDDDDDGIPTAEESPDPNNDGNIDDALDSDSNGTPDYLQAAVLDSDAEDDLKKTATNTAENASTADIFEDTTEDTSDATTKVQSIDRENTNAQQQLPSTVITSDADEANKLTQEMLAIAQQKIADTTQRNTSVEASADTNTDADIETGVNANKEETVDVDANITDTFTEQSAEKQDKTSTNETTVGQNEERNKKNTEKANKEEDANNVTLTKDIAQSTDNATPKDSVLSSAKLYFPFRSSKTTLAASVTEYIDEVKQYLQTNPQARVKVTGHTDNVGTARNNKKLGLKRAEMVRDILIENGVSGTQILIESQGEAQPISDNSTEAGRKLNRRVELKPLPREE